jgi:hypothetical protein
MVNGVSLTSAAGLLPAYVALGHWRTAGSTLDGRLELLVAQLSAELSACGWCIEQGRHRWRKAALPAGLLGQLRSYRTSPLVSERDAAALALTEAVARYTEREPFAADPVLASARRYFSEAEVVRIAQLAAGEHFFDPASGAVGQDVAGPVPRSTGPPMPWSAIAAGIAIRGWL